MLESENASESWKLFRLSGCDVNVKLWIIRTQGFDFTINKVILKKEMKCHLQQILTVSTSKLISGDNFIEQEISPDGIRSFSECHQELVLSAPLSVHCN